MGCTPIKAEVSKQGLVGLWEGCTRYNDGYRTSRVITKPDGNKPVAVYVFDRTFPPNPFHALIPVYDDYYLIGVSGDSQSPHPIRISISQISVTYAKKGEVNIWEEAWFNGEKWVAKNPIGETYVRDLLRKLDRGIEAAKKMVLDENYKGIYCEKNEDINLEWTLTI
jgi:hypothetical protein